MMKNTVKNTKFTNYLDYLIEYQRQLLPDNNLCEDYIILYEYLLDLLEKDDVIGEFIVRKKQQTSKINADILLDLTTLFNVRSYIHDPFVCLTLNGVENKQFENNLHPFCNKKLSILPRNIKKYIWLALNRGISINGSFIRGCKGDIYELNLSVNDPNDNYIRLNAFCDDMNLNVNLRILVKYYKKPQSDYMLYKPFPEHQFNKEWLAKLGRQSDMPFEICLPKLENEMQQKVPNCVMVMRLIRSLFKNNTKLCILDSGFLESVIYSEFMDINASKNYTTRNDYILKGVLTHIFNALKAKKCPCFWNERSNFMKSFFKNESLLTRAFNEFKNLLAEFNKLRNNHSLTYEESFDFFDFKMEPGSYEIDEFGIFKTY